MRAIDVGMGSVSEDSVQDLNFWREFEPGAKNRRMDVRYIYLNGGPVENGWTTWTYGVGDRARSFIRESQKLGIVPYFVYYNIPDGGESYTRNNEHINSTTYMEAYYKDLKLALDISREVGGDDLVGFIFEPDFIGYLAQLHPVGPTETFAAVSAAYTSGVLDTEAGDPLFPNTVTGLVQSINYLASKLGPNVDFGWQLNLWASPQGGHTGIQISGQGLMHNTDGKTGAAFDQARAEIYTEAAAITQYYLDAGIGSHGADFLSIDKYGLDAAQQSGAEDNPAGSNWFWNADHWNNYLEFVRAMNETGDLPVVLWQIPCGRINSSQATNPYDASGLFPDLPNTATRYEDSSAAYFFGDTFEVSGARHTHFSANNGGDPDVSVDGNRVTWGPHVEEARDAGVTTILFGAGVGISTDGVGSPPTDDYWWITRSQEYFDSPVPR